LVFILYSRRKEAPDDCEPPVITETANGNPVVAGVVDEPKEVVTKEEVKPPARESLMKYQL